MQKLTDLGYVNHTKYVDYVDLKKLYFIVRNVKEATGNDRNSQRRLMDVGCGSGNIAIPLWRTLVMRY